MEFSKVLIIIFYNSNFGFVNLKMVNLYMVFTN